MALCSAWKIRLEILQLIHVRSTLLRCVRKETKKEKKSDQHQRLVDSVNVGAVTTTPGPKMRCSENLEGGGEGDDALTDKTNCTDVHEPALMMH